MDIRRFSVRHERGVASTGDGVCRLPKAGAGWIRRSGFLTFLLLVLLAGLPGGAAAELTVGQHAFAQGIEAREPVGSSETFAADVGRVYFFTQILGAAEPSDVVHVWIYDGREVAIVPLVVNGPSWRTWSSKRILPEWRGDWTVEVRDSASRVLLSATCRVE